MDKASIVYKIDGTTRNMTVEGGHLTVQMLDHCTIVTVSDSISGRVSTTHMFRWADYVEIHRGG